MNATDVVGYAYEADVHCLGCTEERFPNIYDDLRAPETDSEGNEISPIFAGEGAYSDCSCCEGKGSHGDCKASCGTCDGEGKEARVCGDCLEDLIGGDVGQV